MSEAHLRALLTDWRAHYNKSRPHMTLGPGFPDPPAAPALVKRPDSRHRLREGLVIQVKPVLSGLHHEYALVQTIA
jgi:hypothetical protein